MSQFAQFISKPLIAVALLGTLGGAAYAAPAAAKAAPAATPADMLKSELKITAAQEPAWKQFMDTYALPFKPSRDMTNDQFNAMSTPDRISFLKTLRNEETTFLNNRLDASLKLYSALDAGQKKQFDELTAQRPPQQGGAAAPKAKAKGKK